MVGDSHCEPRAAHDQAERLISQEKVELLIGEWCSSASVAVAQVANDEKVPLLVNISTADQIAGDSGPYAYQSSMQNRYSQEREATLLQKDFKFESVAIIVEPILLTLAPARPPCISTCRCSKSLNGKNKSTVASAPRSPRRSKRHVRQWRRAASSARRRARPPHRRAHWRGF